MPIAAAVNKLFRVDLLEQLYDKARARPGFFGALLSELDVNPIIVRPVGAGVAAVDVLIRLGKGS